MSRCWADSASFIMLTVHIKKGLPVVLSEEEVQRILLTVKNLKHKCILLVIYSVGLRIGELINLQMADIDKDRRMIHIKRAKGKKTG